MFLSFWYTNYFTINTSCWTEIKSFYHTNLNHLFLSLFCGVFVLFGHCPAPGDIQNVHLQKLLEEFKKLLLKYSEKSTTRDTWQHLRLLPVLLQQNKDVNLLQKATAAWDSCLISSYGYGNSAMLLHPWGTALREKHRLDENASLSSPSSLH